MSSPILSKIQKIMGSEFKTNPRFNEAFRQDKNRRLAQIGDSLLSLFIREREYWKPNSTAQDIEVAKQKVVTKDKMRNIVNGDIEFTRYLVKEHGCTSPIGNIGLERSDAFIEAIIGAIFVEKENEKESGYKAIKDFCNSIFNYK